MIGLKENMAAAEDGDDDVSNVAALSVGMEAARDVIDAYKSSLKENREFWSWTEKERERGGRGGDVTGSEWIWRRLIYRDSETGAKL